LRPDIIHVWTPRECVRKITECVLARSIPRPKLVIHLEDNEERIVEIFTGTSFQILATEAESVLNALPDGYSHPLRYKEFLRSADAATVIFNTLEVFIPATTQRIVLWPGVDTNRFNPQVLPSTHPALKNLKPDERVIVYSGNAHLANESEVRNLYQAVKILNDGGLKVKLVRTGSDYTDFLKRNPELAEHELRLGLLDWSEIPAVLATADLLIQPGADDAFNRYRFPSKLPEFLAMGKPVILPNSNIGKVLEDGVHALIMHHGGPREIAATVKALLQSPELRRNIGLRGNVFAADAFSWPRIVKQLGAFYRSILSGNRAVAAHRSIQDAIINDLSERELKELKAMSRTRAQAALADQRDEFSALLTRLKTEIDRFHERFEALPSNEISALIKLLLRFNFLVTGKQSTERPAFFEWMFRKVIGRPKADEGQYDVFAELREIQRVIVALQRIPDSERSELNQY